MGNGELAGAVSRLLGTIGVTALVAGILVSVQPVGTAQALSGSEFNPANIISDALFYDEQAMTQAEIQAFLDAKIGTCLNGRCLNVLVAPVESRPRSLSSTTGRVICEAFEGGTLSAAAIIFRAQNACGISAKVILVTLQKEQGLVLATKPSETALARAMGQACPDTAPCADYALGFSNQVYLGTRQLKTYKAANFARQPGLHSIQFSPDASCGSSPVYLQNYATAALYNYTPYQPNAAALANLGSTGDKCSTYGNRNFWVFYNSWFGSTQAVPAASPNVAARIIALDSAGTLYSYPSNGRGVWLPRIEIATALPTTTRLLGAGDVNGDGDRDLLAHDAQGKLWRYPFVESGRLGEPAEIAGDWTGTTALLSPGDFNGDGAPDLLSRDATGLLWLHSNNGRGVFAPKVQVGNGWTSLDVLLGAGDFNGDNFADVIGRATDGRLILYLGNGRGSWLGSLNIGWGWGGFTDLIIPGDVNGDGTPDVLARTGAGTLWVYPGNGVGGWRTAYPLGPGWNAMVDLEGPGAPVTMPFVDQPGVGDLNGDAARDVLARDTAGNLVIFAGNGRGGWVGSARVSSGWPSDTRFFGVGDLDHDGLPDVASIDVAGAMFLHSGNRRGAISEGRLIGQGWQSFDLVFYAGDFDGDGNGDLIARDSAGLLWLYPGDGTGSFSARVQVGNGWSSLTAVFSVGDFNGDGTQDVVARAGDGSLWLYPGDGRGSWQRSVQIGVGWQSLTALFSPGDFNGDGFTDVLARDSMSRLILFPGNGSGGWRAVSVIGWGWAGLTSIQ